MMKDEDILIVDQPDLGPAERLYLPQILDGMKTTIGHLARSITGRTLTVQYPSKRERRRIIAASTGSTATRTVVSRAWHVTCARRRVRPLHPH